jgi:glycosyltransferase involved in cell wall biosynthesis
MRVLTVTSPASLARARVLGDSLRRHQPDWVHEILLLARGEIPGAEPASGRRVRSVCGVLDLDLEALLALHDEDELTVLLVPHLLQHYLGLRREPILHLPSSVWVRAQLEPVAAAIAERGLLLAARAVEELPDDGLEPSCAQLERAGRVEPAMIGVDGSESCEEFVEWWRGRVEHALGSLDGRRSGERPEDRPWLARYLELAPARFGAAVLQEPGFNLSMWNLHRHRLEGGAEGALVDGGRPLRFLNLPGFHPDHPHRLSPAASRARISRSPALHALCERYANQLRRFGWDEFDHRREVGRTVEGWLIFDESLQAAYDTALALGERFADPFEGDGARAFIEWLQGPAPRGAAHGINRYVFHRVARERPDVVRAYPDLDGPDGADYVAWCWAFGRDELALPERLMPPQPRQPAEQSPARPPAFGFPADDVPSRAPAEPARPPGAEAPDRNGAASALADPVAGERLAVRLTGYMGHTLGLGSAARGYAKALGAAGVPVRTVSVPLHHLELPVQLEDGYGRQGFEDLIHDGAHGFEIVAVNAEELPDLVQRLGEDYFEGPRIGIWGWEVNRIPSHWQEAFALIDEIWVYSRFMAENIGAVATVPVNTLPPPVERPQGPVEPLRLGVPDGFLFLFVFDYLSTVQRKNPAGLIDAFKLAFAPGEGPQLLIKTINGPLRPLAEEAVLWCAHGRPDVHVIDRSLSRNELDGLMAACDCYVSLHRSEGFGLTMAEAMAIGKPVIATGYSGNVDFMNGANSHLVDYALRRVGPECEIYPPEGEWAEPSVEHAAKLMRRVHDERGEAAQLGRRAAADIARTLSSKATGAAMHRRLQELADRAPGLSTSIHS